MTCKTKMKITSVISLDKIKVGKSVSKNIEQVYTSDMVNIKTNKL